MEELLVKVVKTQEQHQQLLELQNQHQNVIEITRKQTGNSTRSCARELVANAKAEFT